MHTRAHTHMPRKRAHIRAGGTAWPRAGAIPSSHTSQLLETEELASEGEQWRDWEADSAFEHPTTELQQEQHRMIHRTGFNLNDIGTKTAKKTVASAHQHQISPSAQRGWANIIAEGQGRQPFRRNGLTELAGQHHTGQTH